LIAEVAVVAPDVRSLLVTPLSCGLKDVLHGFDLSDPPPQLFPTRSGWARQVRTSAAFLFYHVDNKATYAVSKSSLDGISQPVGAKGLLETLPILRV
jgi:hypothetical protein